MTSALDTPMGQARSSKSTWFRRNMAVIIEPAACFALCSSVELAGIAWASHLLPHDNLGRFGLGVALYGLMQLGKSAYKTVKSSPMGETPHCASQCCKVPSAQSPVWRRNMRQIVAPAVVSGLLAVGAGWVHDSIIPHAHASDGGHPPHETMDDHHHHDPHHNPFHPH